MENPISLPNFHDDRHHERRRRRQPLLHTTCLFLSLTCVAAFEKWLVPFLEEKSVPKKKCTQALITRAYHRTTRKVQLNVQNLNVST